MELRNYENSSSQKQVEKTYKKMIECQTLNYVKEKKNLFLQGKYKKINIWDLFVVLDQVIDTSDPDTDLPQSVHAYQTAENLANIDIGKIEIKDLFHENSKDVQRYDVRYIDELYPNIVEWDWFPLVGLVHDLGKIMAVPGYGGLPQWSVVGDTFPVCAPYSEHSVFFEKGWHLKNPDLSCNIYEKNCGFDNVDFSWGHDEYLASILERSRTRLPREAIYLIRYHSFYPWHSPQKEKYYEIERGYTYLSSDRDWKMLPLLKLFQKSDLYSKKEDIPDMNGIKNRYKYLVDRYIPYPLLV